MICIDDEIPFEIPASWEWCRLRGVAAYKKGPFGSSITKSMFVAKSNDTIKVYEQKNAIKKDATLGSYYISNEKFNELKGFELLPNDIIVSCAGTIGETYVMPEKMEQGIINQALMYIRLFDNNLRDFYLIYFESILKQEAISKGKGTAIKNIPPFDVLKDFLIPIPPIPEQNRIILEVNNILDKVINIDDNIDDVKSAIKQAKAKVLDLAIKGKLVPQDPTDEPASVLLERIKAEKKATVKPTKRGAKTTSTTSDNSHYENVPFEVPDSWVWVALEDVLDYEQPQNYIVEDTDYSNLYTTPVLTAGKSFIIGYTNETKGIYNNLPAIIFDDFTTDSRYVDFEFKVKSSAMKILRPCCTMVNLKYIAYFMSVTRLIGDTHKRYWISEYAKLLMPMPPFHEQNRIIQRIEVVLSYLDELEESLR